MYNLIDIRGLKASQKMSNEMCFLLYILENLVVHSRHVHGNF